MSPRRASARALRGSRRARRPVSSAGLAAMVDLLTLLLLFLLKSYATDAPVRPGELDFRLPDSTAEAPVSGLIHLDITADGIFLEGARAAGTDYYLSSEDALIQGLYAPLLQLGGPRVLVRAHEETPYRLLRKVLFTAREAGVREVQVIATSRSSL